MNITLNKKHNKKHNKGLYQDFSFKASEGEMIKLSRVIYAIMLAKFIKR